MNEVSVFHTSVCACANEAPFRLLANLNQIWFFYFFLFIFRADCLHCFFVSTWIVALFKLDHSVALLTVYCSTNIRATQKCCVALCVVCDVISMGNMLLYMPWASEFPPLSRDPLFTTALLGFYVPQSDVIDSQNQLMHLDLFTSVQMWFEIKCKCDFNRFWVSIYSDFWLHKTV